MLQWLEMFRGCLHFPLAAGGHWNGHQRTGSEAGNDRTPHLERENVIRDLVAVQWAVVKVLAATFSVEVRWV